MADPVSSPTETAQDLMIADVVTAKIKEDAFSVIKRLSTGSWGDIHYVYVLSDEGKLLGMVPIVKLLSAKNHEMVGNLIEKPKATVAAEADQEKVVVEAVKNDLKTVPVVDKENNFLGIVPADKIIDVLHEEHLEDFLRLSGIRGRGSKLLELMSARLLDLVEARLPWLVVGLAISLVSSLMVSQFETSLRQNIALVFFMPVIGYISDAIGTQTETILIRSLAFIKFNIINYIIRELIVGIIIGSIVGLLAGIFAYLLAASLPVALVVGLSLLLSMSVATVLASLTPVLLNSLGRDPAMGSGPFTTALQYMISLLIYLTVAALVLR